MTDAPELPDDETLAVLGTEAILIGVVDAVRVVVEVDEQDGEDLSAALNVLTTGFAMLAGSGPYASACLDRLLLTGVLAWDELGAVDARQGVADVFDVDERRCFALVSKATGDNIAALPDRVFEKLGGSYQKALSVALMVTARMLFILAEVLEVDAEGALDATRALPEDQE